MTLRRPSKISLSFLLSSSFLICDTEAVRDAYEDGLKLLTELADWAASRVSSRAVRKAISQLYGQVYESVFSRQSAELAGL